MPLIVTPGQFTQRAELYHQLSQLTAAGMDLLRSLEQLQRHPPSRSFRAPLRTLILELGHGCTFTEALRQCGGWLPEFDIALIEAGERSGRLDSCFKLLADYYHDRARVARQMIGDLIYPVALLHFAVVIFAFVDFFKTGNVVMFVAKTLGVLLPLYVIVIAMIYAGQSKHGERWRALMETLCQPIPLLGTARHYLALARLAAALEALIAAGTTIIEAWEIAAAACGSPGIRRVVKAWKPDLLAGQTPADSVSQSSWFPETFTNLYHTGEVSGTLDTTLRKLHKYYQEEGSRKLHNFVRWSPQIVYLIIAGIIGYKVIQFYAGIYGPNSDLGRILNGN